MKKLYKNGLYLLMAGAIVASCADYNETDGFSAEPDPTFTTPYADLATVNSYIDKTSNPNLSIGATLDIAEFNKQELAHCAVMANFDNVSFGKTLMSKTIVNDLGVMNFIQMNDLLEHMDEIGGEVYGSPIVANANQAGKWIKTLTAPIEIPVDYVPGKSVNYNDYPVGAYDGTVTTGKVSIVKYDDQNVLRLAPDGNKAAKANVIEGFEVDPTASYTVTIWAKTDAAASFNVYFSDNKIDGTATKDGKWSLAEGAWKKIEIPCTSAPDATEGYLRLELGRGYTINIRSVEVGYYPDNHRPQTEEEISDTIHYALNTWCDGLMKINKGRIKSFDLIDEPIDNTVELENGMYDIKHDPNHTAKMDEGEVFWQDYLGSENYAPEVAKVTREAFEKYEGNLDDLKLFISERGLEDPKKMESLIHWIGKWDAKGAKIDGINAKVNLVYYEDPEKQAENKAAYEALLTSLAATKKLVRVSNFDIKYVDANNLAVITANITAEQRQKLADYNAYALKTYMSKIPSAQQAGICKDNLVDGTDPVGLWTKDIKLNNDWARNATYKAWCEALSGK